MNDNSDNVEYLIDIDLGENGGHVLAQTPDEIQSWVAEEDDQWKWLRGFKPSGWPNVINEAVRFQVGAIDNIKNALETYEINKFHEQHLDQLRRNIAEYYLSATFPNRAIHSSTTVAQRLKKVADEVGLNEAVAALAFATNRPVPLSDRQELFRGMALYVIMGDGITKRSAAASLRAADKVIDTIRDTSSELKLTTDKQEKALTKLIGKCASNDERGVKALANAVRQLRTQSRTQIAEAKQELTDLKDLYDKKLALMKPVEYWSDKRWKHRVWTVVYAALFVVYLLAVGFVGYDVLQGSELSKLDFWKDIKLGQSALLIVGVGLLVSIARILYRLAISNLHLGNDADERVTMVNTFLALDREGTTVTDHTKLLLERLFAPAADGIVKDDFGPVTVGDAVSRLIGRS